MHYPATYAAGVYNRLESRVNGRTRQDESVVNLPNWLPLSFRHNDGPWFAPGIGDLLHHHAVLDLRRGLYLRELVVRDPQQRRTCVKQERLVSMERPHLAGLRTTITPLDWSGTLHVRSLQIGRAHV